MTTVLDTGSGDAGTHVFVVGVGSYDHLVDGQGVLLDNPFGLRQLGSPPVSAKRFAEWALSNLKNPAAPVVSVEVLISAESAVKIDVPGAGEVDVQPATMANIKTAFDRWYARADAHADNVAIFYHCGHGLESSDLALLAQDFGAPGGDPPKTWNNAYNFHRTYRGMARCKAKAQFFFVDACRQVSADVLEFDGGDLASLIDLKLRGLNNKRNAPILYASARESRAFARVDGVSRFTGALIDALNTNAARNTNGSWIVSNLSLAEAVIKRIQRGNLPGVPEQSCVVDGESSGTSVLHILDAPPAVPAYVRPGDGHPFPASASLEFRIGDSPTTEAPGPSPWTTEVVAGVYKVLAIDGGNVLSQLPQEWVMPPEYERELP